MTVGCFTLLCFLKGLLWVDGCLGLLGFRLLALAELASDCMAVMSIAGLVMASNREVPVSFFSFNISMGAV